MNRFLSIALFVIIFNAALPTVAGFGLFYYQASAYTGVSTANILSINGCTQNANGTLTCNPQLPQAAGSLPNLLVFGDYFDAFVTLIKSMGVAIVIPGYILLQFGFPATVVALYSLGIYMLFGYFVYDAISGRNQSGTNS